MKVPALTSPLFHLGTPRIEVTQFLLLPCSNK